MNEQRPLAYKTHPAEWFLSLTRKERAEQIRISAGEQTERACAVSFREAEGCQLTPLPR